MFPAKKYWVFGLFFLVFMLVSLAVADASQAAFLNPTTSNGALAKPESADRGLDVTPRKTPDTIDNEYVISIEKNGSSNHVTVLALKESPSEISDLPALAAPLVKETEPAPIDAAVLNQIHENGTAEYWIILTSQADLSAAPQITDWNTRGQYVYDQLTSLAEDTQSSLRALLSNSGTVYTPYWIINAIFVKSDGEILSQVSLQPGIKEIIAPITYTIPEPILDNEVLKVNAIEWNISRINAPQVWSTFSDIGQGIVVANIDTGVQYNHPALVSKYRGFLGGGLYDHNYNWFDPALACGSPSLVPCDNNGHGTHTMGTMVGDDGGSNQIGVAPGARFIIAKGCESNTCSDYSLLASAQWILAPTDLNGANPRPDLRPNIVNNSWGSETGGNFWYQGMVQAWVASGVFPAFSIGNSGPSCGTAGSPGDYVDSYGVGGFDISNSVYFNSSRGPADVTGLTKPNISAPAVSVRSSVPSSSYASYTGTSMASPHLAATVALMWSAAPSLIGDIAATRTILDQTAIDTSDLTCGGAAANNNVWGEGRLDAFAAVTQSPRGPLGTLQGTLTVAETSQPISGATIQIVGPITRQTTTNASGFYSINLDVGVYTVSASKHGYSTQTAIGVMIILASTTVQDFALNTMPTTTVNGIVTDGSGMGGPLAANILITTPGFSQNIYTSDGNYSISLYQGTDYTFKINTIASGYREKKLILNFITTLVTRNFVMEVDPVSCTAPGYRPGYTYYQDFETSTGGFSQSGSTWAWGAPMSGSGVAYSGVKVWATNLTGIYPNSFDGSITSPNINLSSLAGKSIVVHWWQWADIENGWDNIYVSASKNGGTSWTQIYAFTGREMTWKRQQIILDSSYAVAIFRIRFNFTSDSSIAFSGYYLDDIGIGGVAPINESFESGSIPAGWSVYDLDWGGTSWVPSNLASHAGTQSAAHLFSTASNQNGWLVTPDILLGSNASSLVFWEFNGWASYYAGHFTWFCDESSPSGCGSPPFNYSYLVELGNPNGTWRDWGFSLSGMIDHTIRFAWQYTGFDADDWYIDQVTTSSTDLPLLACSPISDAQLTYTPPAISMTVDLGAPPTTTNLTITNLGLSTASFNINEYNLGFSPLAEVQAVNIPAVTDDFEHSPVSLGPAPEQLPPIVSDTVKQPEASEVTSIINGINAYALDISDISHTKLVNFNTSTPGTFTTIGDLGAHKFVAGDFLNGDTSKLFTLDYSTNHFFSVNTSSSALTDIGIAAPLANHAWSGLTGGMNGVLYASSSDCGSESEIYSINISTGAATPLVNVSNATCLVDIAINANGEMYGVDIASDMLIQINLNNGVGTPIGSLGVDANYAQGLSFDQISGILYWAAYLTIGGGQLRVIDTDSGASALLGAFPNQHETDGLAFPTNGGNNIPWLSEAPTSGGVSGNSNVTVAVTFSPPTLVSELGSYNGQLKIGNDTKFGTGIVPVTMNVQIPYTWGWLQGTVSGLAECDGAGSALMSAKVTISDMSDVILVTLYTNASGFYRYPLPAGNYKMSVTHLNYLALNLPGITTPSGRNTSTQDFTLRRKLPCINPSSPSLSASSFTGNSLTQGLVLNNTGGGVGTALLLERSGGGTQTNLLQDPSLEIYASYPTSPWQQYSLNYGTVYWTYSGGGSGPHTGDVWAWFGGVDTNIEEGYIKQNITIPSGTAYLIFWLSTPVCANGTADYMNILIDGGEIFRVDGSSPSCNDPSYYPHIIDISAYANGIAHEVKFFSHTIGGGALTNFMVDDIAVESPGATDVAWLIENPTILTIPPDSSSSTDITLNAASLGPGIYNATIILEALPKQTVKIPVTLTVGGAPSALTATTYSSSQINLHWSDNSSNEEGFKIERSPNGSSSWAEIGSVGPNIQDFPNTGLTCDTTYYYRVRAYRGSFYSSYSGVTPGSSGLCTPTGLTATTISQTQINLNWTDTNNNENGYKVERSPDGITAWAQIGTTGVNVANYQDLTVGCGTTYYYRVRGYLGGYNSDYSNIAAGNTIPCKPVGLTATTINSSQINLYWTDNSHNEDSFIIQRSSDGLGGWVSIGTVGSNIQDYPDSGLPCGTDFWYRVGAHILTGMSPWSDVAHGVTDPCIPTAPSNLEVTSTGLTWVLLHWDDNSNNEDGFIVERSPNGIDGWEQVGTTGANQNSYRDENLTSGTNYSYRVYAYGSSGNSGYSNVVFALTEEYLYFIWLPVIVR